MSFAERHNKVEFSVPFDTSGFEFKKCADLKADTDYMVYGWFSSDGKYGKSYSLILSDCFLNLPKYMNGDMDDMDSTDVNDVNNGRVAVRRKDYVKDGRQHSTITWVDNLS